MATLSELRTRIARILSNDSLIDPTSAEIDTQLNLTIDYYETEHFWFNEERVSITLTPGDPVVPNIPSDFKQELRPNGLVVLEGNVRYPLLHVTPLEYDTLNVDGQGLPTAYTYRDGQFLLYYYPDQAYTCFLFYLKTYVDLASDGDSNDFTNNAERLVTYKTVADLLRDFRDDEERAARYDARVFDEYRKIKRETENRILTGRVSTENIIDRGRTHYYYQR